MEICIMNECTPFIVISSVWVEMSDKLLRVKNSHKWLEKSFELIGNKKNYSENIVIETSGIMGVVILLLLF